MLISAKVSISKRAQQHLAYATSSLAATGRRYLSTLAAVPLCKAACGAAHTPTFMQPKKANMLFFNTASTLITGPIKKHFA